jgi:hypothetical protein
MQKRDLRKVTRWKELALALYRKLYGRRCIVCSQYVDDEDAAMYTMEGLDEVILVHRDCDDSISDR